jgi:hypothetical protein
MQAMMGPVAGQALELSFTANPLQYISSIFFSLNNSKLFTGIIMIMMNIGSRYIGIELDKSHESVFSSTIIRRIVIFAIFFTATRDIVTSVFLTIGFVVVFSGLFNNKSKYCIIPKKYRMYEEDIQGKVTDDDVKRATEILKMSKTQKKKEKKEGFMTKKQQVVNQCNAKKNRYKNFVNKLQLAKL